MQFAEHGTADFDFAEVLVFPDQDVENVVRGRLYLPQLSDEDIEEREQQAADEMKAEQDSAAAELDMLRADAERMRGGAQAQPQTPKQGDGK